LKSPRLTSANVYAEAVLPFLQARGLRVQPEDAERVVPLVRERATTFADAAERLDFLFREPPVVDGVAAAKFLQPPCGSRLRALADVIADVQTWNVGSIEAATQTWLASKELAIKDVAQPARVALTGRSTSPGLFEVIEALGKEATLRRLRAAAAATEVGT
jgi:glutamyl-tRNA synthetase